MKRFELSIDEVKESIRRVTSNINAVLEKTLTVENIDQQMSLLNMANKRMERLSELTAQIL